MKLTQKDKVMLTVVVILLSLFVGVWFIIRPAFQEVQESKKEYNEQRSVYQEKEKQVQEKAQLKQEAIDTHAKCIEIASKFYENSTPYDIQEQVYNQMVESNIVVTASTFSVMAKNLAAYSFNTDNAVTVPLDEYARTNDDGTGSNSMFDVIPTQTIGCYAFTITFEGAKREDIFKLVDSLRESEHKTLVVTELTFDVPEATSEEGCDGTISLELYYMNAPDAPVFD